HGTGTRINRRSRLTRLPCRVPFISPRTPPSRPNAKAKLPGPPARTLKRGKLGWRPRSASAVGSAPRRLRGSLRLDSLQRHLEELSPRLPVLRNLPHLEPPTFVIQFNGIAHVAELRYVHPPH